MQLTWYWKSCCLFSYYCCHNHACFHINPSEECGRCWFSCCLEVAEVRLHYWHFARLFWMVACSTRLVGYACWTPTSGCVSSCSALSCCVGCAGAVSPLAGFACWGSSSSTSCTSSLYEVLSSKFVGPAQWAFKVACRLVVQSSPILYHLAPEVGLTIVVVSGVSFVTSGPSCACCGM